ncbi:MAG TPA: hypothetical protein VLU91_05575 [Nitrososphaerales archaeon]|nr:hypothetical protein [Nitrososphaerales archaeon]
MAPNRANKCWLCGRTSDEVNSSVGRIPQETELDRRYARMSDLMGKFNRASGEWGNLIPEQFKTFEFDFILSNQVQFKGMRFLSEVDDSKKSIVIPLRVAIGNVRNGVEASIGGVKIGPSDAAKKEIFLKEVGDFERRTGRSLNGSKGEDSKQNGFGGLRIGQGLAFMREVGMLYFSIQEKMLELEKEDEMSKRPVFSVSIAKVSGLPGEIPICTVCQNLVTCLVPA